MSLMYLSALQVLSWSQENIQKTYFQNSLGFRGAYSSNWAQIRASSHRIGPTESLGIQPRVG